MPTNFEPSSPFEGWVVATLESIKDRLNGLPCDETNKRLSRIENKISNMEGKATLLGAIGGFLVVLFSKYIFRE